MAYINTHIPTKQTISEMDGGHVAMGTRISTAGAFNTNRRLYRKRTARA